MSDQKLKGGLMIIGSLYWDNDPYRLVLREKYLDLDSAKTVEAPIRYGRYSKIRKTYTMVFSSGLSAEEQGKAKLIPIKEKYCNIENIEQVNTAIINAEQKKEAKPSRYNWGWGCLSILLNPKLDDQKISELWDRNFGNGFNPSDYKVGEEQPVVKSNGQLRIPWLDTYNDYDFIIVTATKPEIEKYPSPDELTEIFKKDDHYFLGNYESGIRTFQDGDIIEPLLEFKDFKMTKVGWIPEDWDYRTLNKLTKITSGATPNRKEPKYWNGDIPWVTTSLIKFNRISKAKEFITENGLKNSAVKLFPKGTVLIALYGLGVTRGKCAILDIEATTNQACAALLPSNGINTEFLFYALSANYFRIRNLSNVGGQDNLSGSLLSSFHIPSPKLQEQKAIVQVLSTWDKAIENLTQLITEKQQKKKALMQQLLTGKKRFLGFDEEWKEVQLKDLFKRITRKNAEQNTNVVTISAQRGLVLQDTYFKKNIASEITDNYFLLHKDEFAYNKSYSNGYPMGTVKRLKDLDKAVVTTLYICFDVIDSTQTSRDFFEHFFEVGHLNRRLKKIANEGGRAHGLLNVTPKDFFNLQMKVPGYEEQKKIAEVLNSATKEIELLNQKLNALKDQKKGLMQQLLTGKKRLNFKV